MSNVYTQTRMAIRAPEPLTRLRAVMLLAGAVRATPFSASIGRSALDLPLDARHTVLESWVARVTSLGRYLGLNSLPLRIVLDSAAAAPRLPDASPWTPLVLERDPVGYRGTGGVLRDLSADYGDDDNILVVSGAQVLLEPLVDVVESLAVPRADVSIASHADGSPAGLLLLRAGCLKKIPARGYVDLKEQALPAMALEHTVHVVSCEVPVGLPVRSLQGYIDALRRLHRRRQHGPAGRLDPFEEDWQPTFGVVEEGAHVHPAARIHDSIVLAGARVEANAIVNRCVVAGTGRVGYGSVLCDQVVGAPCGNRGRAA